MTFAILTSAILAAATPATAAPATAAPTHDFGGPRIFQDWIVGCDNGGDCHAASLPAQDDGTQDQVGDGNLRVAIRATGGETPRLSVTLEMAEPSDPADRARAINAIVIDGRALPIHVAVTDGAVRVENAVARTLIVAMRNAQYVALKRTNGEEAGSASLRGLMASLHYIDGQRHTYGTTAALGRPGRVPFSYRLVPDAQPLPMVQTPPPSTAAPAHASESRIAALLATDPCGPPERGAELIRPDYIRLDAQTTLMLLPSYCMGYNAEQRIYVLSNSGMVTPARFGPHPWDDDERGEGEATALPNGWWNERTRTLAGFGKSRGLGDCGQSLEFAWDVHREFRLIAYASMPECRGSYDYITTYRATVIAAEAGATQAVHQQH